MICTKCNNGGVLNQALGKEFYYCRTCKDEIKLEPVAEKQALWEVTDFSGRVSYTALAPSRSYNQLKRIKDGTAFECFCGCGQVLDNDGFPI